MNPARLAELQSELDALVQGFLRENGVLEPEETIFGVRVLFHENDELMAMPLERFVEECGIEGAMRTKILGVMYSNRIPTVGLLVRRSENEVQRMRNFGKTAACTLREHLEKRGLKFSTLLPLSPLEETAIRAHPLKEIIGGQDVHVAAAMKSFGTIGELADATREELLQAISSGEQIFLRQDADGAIASVNQFLCRFLLTSAARG